MLEQDLSQTKQLANERLISIEELKERLDELSSAQDTFIRDGADKQNMSIIQEELHRQADYLRSLETTNIRLTAELSSLRERHASIHVLREEKRVLETKVRTLEEMRDRVVSLEAQIEAARREREEWANKSAEAAQTSTAHSLSVSRLDHARLLEEHGSTKALLLSREAENADLESRNAELATKVEELESKKRTLEDSLLRKQHQVDLAERDVKFLRALVVCISPSFPFPPSNLLAGELQRRIRTGRIILHRHPTPNSPRIPLGNLQIHHRLSPIPTRHCNNPVWHPPRRIPFRS